MGRVYIGLLMSLLCSGALGGPLSHYVDVKSCEVQYEFDYPPEWQVTPLPDEGQLTCRVQIAPKDSSRRLAEANHTDGFIVVVSIFTGSLLQAADANGFDFYQGKWATIGWQGWRDEAEVINTNARSGVRGLATVGCSLARPLENGIGVVACEESRAVFQDAYDHVLTITGSVGSHQVFDTVLSSFKFSDE